VNSVRRGEEYRDASEAPEYPSMFMRTPGSLVGHRAQILRPPESSQLDYEGEIAIVIGGRPADRARAGDAAHRGPDLYDRGNDPRLAAARKVQRHTGEELRALRRRDRDRDADRRGSPVRSAPYLVAGDVVEVDVEGVGTLVNAVADE
jgi:2-keto-4-pentenoate hydratase/2-oxohepta-3-ene-1,7-dioic acid hydratase in catechol pathway